MAQKRYEIDSSLSSNIEIPTKYDDEAFDIDTWSYKQNQYASKYMTDTNNTTRIPKSNVMKNKRVVKQNDSIVTIGTKSFADAFKQARKAGLDKFRWKGRVYGTRYASEVNNTNTAQSNTNASVKSNTSTKNNPSNTSTETTTTPKRTSSSINIPFMSRAKQAVSNARSSTSNTNNNQTGGTTVQRQTIQRLNLDNNENNNQLYYSTAALDNKLNSMPTLRDNTTPSFYEARRRAQRLGQKSFTWKGNTYSTYGRTK